MGRYLLKRTLNYVVMLIIAMILTYFLAAWQLNPLKEEEFMNSIDAETRRQSKLNALADKFLSPEQPIFERFWHWFTGAIRWDWGLTPTGKPVNDEIASRILVSVKMVSLGFIGGALIGIILGAWTATRQYKASDRAVTMWSLITLSTPVLVVAVLLQILATRFNRATGWGWFEFTGETGERSGGFFSPLLDRLQHLLLPTIAIALGGIAVFSRYQRNLMLDVLHADFVRTAQAKGLSRRRAIFKHGLRTALIPTGTLFAFTIATVFVGATITERVFNWNGMGRYFIDSLNNADVHGVVAVAGFGGLCTLTGAVLSEIFVVILDPRVRVN